jgi:hypothetical protein
MRALGRRSGRQRERKRIFFCLRIRKLLENVDFWGTKSGSHGGCYSFYGCGLGILGDNLNRGIVNSFITKLDRIFTFNVMLDI